MEGLNFILNAWNNKELKHLNTFVSMVESNDFTTTKITRILIQIVIRKDKYCEERQIYFIYV